MFKCDMMLRLLTYACAAVQATMQLRVMQQQKQKESQNNNSRPLVCAKIASTTMSNSKQACYYMIVKVMPGL